MSKRQVRKMDFKEFIKARREELGMSYRELSEKTGYSKSVLQRYESGTTKKIPVDRLEVIAKALNIDPFSLYDFDVVQGGEDMTQDEKKKLLNALKIIREECSKHKGKSCEECSLCTDEGCKLKIDAPRDWLLSNEKKDIWRAFS